MNNGDESQTAPSIERPLTAAELAALEALDALELAVPAEEPAPVKPAWRSAVESAKAQMANDREARLEKLREEKRKADNEAYAELILRTEKRPVRSYEPLTPDRKREKERAKYHAKPTSEQSQKRKERRQRAKERQAGASLPEGFGKF